MLRGKHDCSLRKYQVLYNVASDTANTNPSEQAFHQHHEKGLPTHQEALLHISELFQITPRE
jgi:hypothetical protein